MEIFLSCLVGYVFLLIATTLIKVLCCWYGKINYKKEGQSEQTVNAEFEWSYAPTPTKKVFLILLIPFLNIYWRFCVRRYVLNRIGKYWSNGGYVHINSRGITTIGCYSSKYSWSQVLNDDSEKQIFSEMIEDLNEAVLFLPIVLLLLTFFISMVGE